MTLFTEIKRRKIFQVAAVYGVVAWLLIQIVATIEAPLNLPDWFDTMVIVLMGIGFPITLIISWVFNVTPEGIVKDSGEAPAASSGPIKIEYTLIGLMAVALMWLVYRVEFTGNNIDNEIAATDQTLAEAVAENIANTVVPDSIAVLPFANISPDEGDAYFAIGLHEEILHQLTKISNLKVISRTSVLPYVNTGMTIPEIADQLNVTTIMEGSVRFADGRIRVTTQLIDATGDENLWSETYDRAFENIFEIETDIALNVVNAMRVEFSSEEEQAITERPTESILAYSRYLQAISLASNNGGAAFGNDVIADEVHALLDASIELDPEFVAPYVAKFRMYQISRNTELAQEFAEQAASLDPDSINLNIINAYELASRGELDQAMEYLDLALAESPNDAGVLSIAGNLLVNFGDDLERALQLRLRAFELSPNEAEIMHTLGITYSALGNYQAAIDILRRNVEINPGFSTTYLELGNILSATGNYPEALRWVRTAESMNITSNANANAYSALIYSYGIAQAPEEAERLFESFLTLEEMADLPTRARAYLGIRDLETALGLLQQATVDTSINNAFSVVALQIIRDNRYNDPVLELPEFIEVRSGL